MPTRNISLTPEQDRFVAGLIESGEYQNASEAIRDALRALRQRRDQEAAKLSALRALIDIGLDQLEQGDFDEVDDADLEEYMRALRPAAGERGP